MTTAIRHCRPQKLFPVFRQQGLDAMFRAYRANRGFLPYRIKHYALQLLTGVRFHHFLQTVNSCVQTLDTTSMAEASRRVLDRLSFPLSVTWQTDPKNLRGYPVVFYAHHPGYMEPMVCLAALSEPAPRVVATAWIANLSPHTLRWMIPVPDSRETILRDLKRYTGTRRLLETAWATILTFQVIRHLQGDMPAEECRVLRHAATTSILSTLTERKSLLLFPSGGEGQKPWVKEYTAAFEKFMRLVLTRRKRTAVLDEIRFVPVSIGHSLRAFFKSSIMSRHHPVTLLFRLLPDKPFNVTMRKEIVLRDLVKSATDPRDTVRVLLRHLEQ